MSSRLSTALAPWRKPLATHDPGKILLDLAVAVALGGDCLADINQVRADPAVFGPVASDPTVSRLISTLAADAPAALSAINTARAQAWTSAGTAAPNHDRDARHPLIIDLDATLVTAHSDKEQATPNWKKGLGFHPLCGFADHQAAGTGEPLAIALRPGNAGSNTAADHISMVESALAQIPGVDGFRVGKAVLIRNRFGRRHPRIPQLSDQAAAGLLGGVRTDRGHRRNHRPTATGGVDPGLQCQRQRTRRGVGRGADEHAGPSRLARGDVNHRAERETASGSAVAVHRLDWMRLTAFATNTVRGQLAELELRHRRRARCEDRIRTSKDCGLTNLPLHGFD
ncbi:transposase [Gordonia sp. L191]|uniref:transposase n=1 Tax=Gordonia sp. L191 TaxID=2982699 RepID=UPI0024C0E128|nr:transposase [Gordonia sp. L191]WHU48105.1 transposase [Gordonia sp. L191]